MISLFSDNGLLTILILLGLSTAFDTISLELLISSLRFVGLAEGRLSFRNYLFGRSQCVVYGSSLSNSCLISFGVPQGSNLGPLLFALLAFPIW